METGPRLVVQQSFPDPRPTTNPYIVMLKRSIESEPGVELRTFTWRGALLGRYDVFHVHWPEILVAGRSPGRALIRQALTLGLLGKLWATGTPVVRTVHNLEMPSGITRRERALLRAFDRRTALRIRLNEVTEFSTQDAFETILHGHYRDWFAACPRSSPRAGSLAYFGLIRRYKNVERLLEVFGTAVGDLSLHVVGKPSTPELAFALMAQAWDDSRVELELDFVADAELVRIATEAELVVLPYQEMHNSGGVLTALSLDRPVLVPRTAVNESLAQEVGDGWVIQYDDDLSLAALRGAVDAVAERRPVQRPDLSARDWDSVGRRHVDAYRRALRSVRRGRTTV